MTLGDFLLTWFSFSPKVLNYSAFRPFYFKRLTGDGWSITALCALNWISTFHCLFCICVRVERRVYHSTGEFAI